MPERSYANRGRFAAWRHCAPGPVARALVLLAALLLAALVLAPIPLRADGVRILEDDRESLQARADITARARSHIELSYFCIGEDEVALGSMALLREAALRGVRVRVLVDALHNELPRNVQDELIRAGVELREYHPPRLDRPGWIPTRLHDKLWLVDGQEMITGGRNMESRYFGFDEVNFRDRDVYVAGEAAAAASRYFDSIWGHEEVTAVSRTPATRTSSVPAAGRRISDGPAPSAATTTAAAQRQLSEAREALATKYGVLPPRGPTVAPPPSLRTNPVQFWFDPPGEKATAAGISGEIEGLVAAARQSIEIETPYLVLSDRFRAALAAARQRGVRVQITTNSLASTNSILAQAAYTAQRDQMRELGIELWEFRGPRCLHAKSFVVDDRLALIGSFNLDPRSELRDTQVAVLIDDPRIASQLSGFHAGNRANAVVYVTDQAEPPAAEEPAVRPKRKALFGLSRLLWPLVKDEL